MTGSVAPTTVKTERLDVTDCTVIVAVPWLKTARLCKALAVLIGWVGNWTPDGSMEIAPKA